MLTRASLLLAPRQVVVEDVTPSTVLLSLLGPGALAVACAQGLVTDPGLDPGLCRATHWPDGRSVRVVRDPLLGSGTPVVTLVCEAPLGDTLDRLKADQVTSREKEGG